MKTTTRIALCLLILLAASTRTIAQEKKTAKVTILVPIKTDIGEETEVKVGSLQEFEGSTKEEKGDWYWADLKGEGGTRVFKVSVTKDKSQKFKVEALIQPNNYEKITRVKAVALKAGDSAKLDMTVSDPKNLDRIKARWVPTPDDIVDKMSQMAKVGKNDIVYDLGCGDAVMLIRPIQKFGAKKGVGIDIDPEILKKAKENVKDAKLENKVELRQGDILDVKDMSEATVVLLYIGDELGTRLSPVLKNTLKPGARIVSHRFNLGDWAPTRTETVTGADGYEYTLHIWVVGEKKKKK